MEAPTQLSFLLSYILPGSAGKRGREKGGKGETADVVGRFCKRS